MIPEGGPREHPFCTPSRCRIIYPGFPADVLFNFRLCSVAAQVILWSVIGLIFAPMPGRLLAPGPASAWLRRDLESAAV